MANTLIDSKVLALRLLRAGRNVVHVSDQTALERREVIDIARAHRIDLDTTGKPIPGTGDHNHIAAAGPRLVPPVPMAAPLPTRPVHRDLLAAGQASQRARTRNLATRVKQLLDQLRQAVEGEAELAAQAQRQHAERAQALAEVDRLKVKLAAALAKTGKKPAAPAKARDPKWPAIRAWAHANGHDCPKTGKVPGRIVTLYDARG